MSFARLQLYLLIRLCWLSSLVVAGYTGKSCTEDVDECVHAPCENGATCVNTAGSFQCTCPDGYTGSLCETDPCTLHDPCLNNATCLSQPGDTTCLCSPLFTGEDCGKGMAWNFIFLPWPLNDWLIDLIEHLYGAHIHSIECSWRLVDVELACSQKVSHPKDETGQCCHWRIIPVFPFENFSACWFLCVSPICWLTHRDCRIFIERAWCSACVHILDPVYHLIR
jgi:hypothetical protein